MVECPLMVRSLGRSKRMDRVDNVQRPRGARCSSVVECPLTVRSLGHSKQMDRVDNVQGPRGSSNQNEPPKMPLVWGPSVFLVHEPPRVLLCLCVMGYWIKPSWRTHSVILYSSQCSTTGVRKVMVCAIVYVGWCI